METVFLTKSQTVIDLLFTPTPYSPIFKTMPVYATNPASGSSPVPMVTFSGWTAQIVMTTRGFSQTQWQFSANLYPDSYAGQLVEFGGAAPNFCEFVSSQPLKDGIGVAPTVQFVSAQGPDSNQWSANVLAPIIPGDYIGAVSKSGTVSQTAYSGTNTTMGQAFPVAFYVPQLGINVIFTDGAGTTTTFTNWGGNCIHVDTGLYWTSNNGTNAFGGPNLNYVPPQPLKNWASFIPTPVNGGICRITNYPTLTGDPISQIAFVFTTAHLIQNLRLFAAPDSQANRIKLAIANEVAFVWPEIEFSPTTTWRVCYTEYGALIYCANDGGNDVSFIERTPTTKVYYVDFPSRIIYPVRMYAATDDIFDIDNDPAVIPGTPDALFTEFVWGRDGLYYVSNYGLFRDARAQPNADMNPDPNGGCAAITVARATFIPPPRPVLDMNPRGVGHFPFIDVRSYTDTDKPK